MKIFLSIFLSFILALLAYIKNAMTKPALLLAFIFSCLITYYGDIISFIILLIVFLGSLIGSKIKNNIRNQIQNDIILKPHQKDIFQIIANVGIGTFSIIIYAITKNELLLIIYSSIMAESLADTLASDIGVLSKKTPINILTLKKGQRGLSGNISSIGLISSFIGALLIGLIYYSSNFQIPNLLIITISGFIGAIIDSFLGASIQVQYICPKCHKITERKEHCNQKTTHYKGKKIINNDVVNFLSNFIAGIISLITLIILK